MMEADRPQLHGPQRAVAVLIDGRNRARTVSELGMRCDATEMPEPAETSEPVIGRWIGRAAWTGSAPLLRPDGKVAVGPAFQLAGLFALAVTKERALCIVASDNVADPALWITAPREGLDVEMEGGKGLFAKRPAIISLFFGENVGGVGLSDVTRVFLPSRRGQPRQEKSLLEALATGRTETG